MISIHALLAESDVNLRQRDTAGQQFLSTLSLRRATVWVPLQRVFSLFLSTLSLRRATTCRSAAASWWRFLSTLSLRRATSQAHEPCRKHLYFYPRSPCGERLHAVNVPLLLSTISIHALLAESDAFMQQLFAMQMHFYPRSPCGERPRSSPGRTPVKS